MCASVDTTDQLDIIEPTPTVKAKELKELVAMALTVRSRDRAGLGELESRVYRYILARYPLLGRAPSSQEIADALGLKGPKTVRTILKILHALDLVEADGGEVRSAYPFSTVATNHIMRFNGWAESKPVYALCAVDALGIPFMLQRDVSITSSCAHCARPIAIEVRNGAIVAHHPTETVVWAGTTRTGRAATSICPTINFFCSSGHVEAWRRDRPEESGSMLSLGEALYLGRGIFQDALEEKPDTAAATANTSPEAQATAQRGKPGVTVTSVGGLVAALFASVCCFGPLVLAALGVGAGATGFLASTAGFLKALLPYRPVFVALSAGLLGFAFYLAYRRAGPFCTVRESCLSGSEKLSPRMLLWLAAAVAAALILSPYWLALLTG